ncbi:MAG: D-alanyl-D-alanine carboxypeptidase/D-alanyl-D-alanine endopeptidase [Actinomycetes bacterium]
MPDHTSARRLAAAVAALGTALVLAPTASAGATVLPSSVTAATVGSTATFGSAATHAAAKTGPPLSATDQVVFDSLTSRATAKALGPDLAGMVTDAATGRLLWARTPFERQIPASNAKLLTAVNALSTFGPSYRFSTRVVQGLAPQQLVLVGAGDPSFSRASLSALATRTAAAVRAKGLTRVSVYVDDSLFPRPSLAYGWRSSYVPNDARAVRALVVNRQRRGDTSLDAGRTFAALLKGHGLAVKPKLVSHRKAPAGAPSVATVKGLPLSTMIGTMLRESDNDYAEALHRLVATKVGFAATWTGARLAQRQVLLTLGVDLGASTMYDGSGLSRADRLAPNDLVRVLSLVFDGQHPALAGMQHGALAIAGRTGTLGPRYLRYTTKPTSCAAGLIEAKTGSLSGVISLSGFARGKDGRIKLFSFLLNWVPSTLTTRRAVDKLATSITGCWPLPAPAAPAPLPPPPPPSS